MRGYSAIRGRAGGPGRPARPDRTRGDDGLLTPSAAALFPVVMLIILTMFQAVVYFEAQEHAQAAAAEGARAARLYNATAPAGTREARLLLSQTGGGWLLSDPTVTASRTAAWAQVQVGGTAPSLIPGVHLRVSKTVSGPVERLTTVP